MKLYTIFLILLALVQKKIHDLLLLMETWEKCLSIQLHFSTSSISRKQIGIQGGQSQKSCNRKFEVIPLSGMAHLVTHTYTHTQTMIFISTVFCSNRVTGNISSNQSQCPDGPKRFCTGPLLICDVIMHVNM